jgi:stage III sporulation protein SpoIIIAA
MIEAVENHMPEVVIVDEIGTEAEALACRTIAERGGAVQVQSSLPKA